MTITFAPGPDVPEFVPQPYGAKAAKLELFRVILLGVSSALSPSLS
jgi:hypothetical protein